MINEELRRWSESEAVTVAVCNCVPRIATCIHRPPVAAALVAAWQAGRRAGIEEAAAAAGGAYHKEDGGTAPWVECDAEERVRALVDHDKEPSGG